MVVSSLTWNVELINLVFLLLAHQKDGVIPEVLLEQVTFCYFHMQALFLEALKHVICIHSSQIVSYVHLPICISRETSRISVEFDAVWMQ
jgi:hypothetical protein